MFEVLNRLPPEYVSKILAQSEYLNGVSIQLKQICKEFHNTYFKQFCLFLKDMYDNGGLTDFAYSRLLQSSRKLSFSSLYGVIQQQKNFRLICQEITNMTTPSHSQFYPIQGPVIFFLKHLCSNPDIIPSINPDKLDYSSVDSEGYLMIYLCEMSGDKKQGWEVSSRAKGSAFIYDFFVKFESDGLNKQVYYKFSEDMTVSGEIKGGILVANSIIIGSLKLYGKINFGFLVRLSLDKLKMIFEKIKECRLKFAVPEKLILAFLSSLHKTIRNIDPYKLTVQRIQNRGLEYIYFGELQKKELGSGPIIKKFGYGAMLFSTELISVGFWNNNVQQGTCIYWYPDGTTKSGTLNNEKFVSNDII